MEISAFLKTAEKNLDLFIEATAEARLQFISSKIRPEAWPKNIFRLPRYQAHRGFWKDGHPQNSILAFEAAARHGALICELDVRLTRDRVPVLFHDETLEHLGHPELRLDELSLEELQSYTAVNTLKEVLRHKTLTPYFNIELKSEKLLDDPLERFVAKVVKETNSTERVLFSSFNPGSIWKISHLLPEVPRALLVSPEMEKRSLREMWAAPFIRIQMLNMDYRMINRQSMEQWKKLGVPIAVWTPNDEKEIAELFELGVDSIISDLSPSVFADR